MDLTLNPKGQVESVWLSSGFLFLDRLAQRRNQNALLSVSVGSEITHHRA